MTARAQKLKQRKDYQGRVYDYLVSMTELEPHLPAEDKADLQRFYETRAFGVRDSDWPGWEKYLGTRPAPRALTLLTFDNGGQL